MKSHRKIILEHSSLRDQSSMQIQWSFQWPFVAFTLLYHTLQLSAHIFWRLNVLLKWAMLTACNHNILEKWGILTFTRIWPLGLGILIFLGFSFTGSGVISTAESGRILVLFLLPLGDLPLWRLSFFQLGSAFRAFIFWTLFLVKYPRAHAFNMHRSLSPGLPCRPGILPM